MQFEEKLFFIMRMDEIVETYNYYRGDEDITEDLLKQSIREAYCESKLKEKSINHMTFSIHCDIRVEGDPNLEQIIELDVRSEAKIKYLPPNLVYLDVGCASSLLTITEYPESLRELTIRNYDIEEDIYIPPQIKTFTMLDNHKIKDSLPDSLEKFVMFDTFASLDNLPASLKHLELCYYKGDLNNLPCNLETIKFMIPYEKEIKNKPKNLEIKTAI